MQATPLSGSSVMGFFAKTLGTQMSKDQECKGSSEAFSSGNNERIFEKRLEHDEEK